MSARRVFTAIFAVWCSGAVHAETAGPVVPVRWAIAKVSGAPALPGGRVGVALVASILPGWHLYPTDEPEGGPISTQFGLAEGDAAELLSVGAPKPLRVVAALPGGGADDVGFYAGQTTFGLHLQVLPGTAPGPHTLHVTVRYQACNDRLCLPPRSELVAVPVTVRLGRGR